MLASSSLWCEVTFQYRTNSCNLIKVAPCARVSFVQWGENARLSHVEPGEASQPWECSSMGLTVVMPNYTLRKQRQRNTPTDLTILQALSKTTRENNHVVSFTVLFFLLMHRSPWSHPAADASLWFVALKHVRHWQRDKIPHSNDLRN